MHTISKLKALEELREKAKEGMWIGVNTTSQWLEGWAAIHAFQAYHGSLDAAKALMDAMLPEWEVETIRQQDPLYDWLVVLIPKKGGWDAEGGSHCLARAWLIAILSALIEIEGQ